MEWAAAVRRDAAPSTEPASAAVQRLQLDSLRSCEDNIAVAIIDANALISFNSSAHLLKLACSSSSQGPRFVTVKDVLEEVRAPDSRFHLSALPCSLECIDPSDEALQKVVRFARETGDLASLSDVDLKLLALTYMLEEQMYGSAHLRVRPPPVRIAQVRGLRDRDLPGWGTNVVNLEEWEQLSQMPETAIEEGSHILGLRKLSLNSFQQGNILSDEEHKSSTDREGLVHPSQEKKTHFEQTCIMPVLKEKHTSTGRDEGQGLMMPSVLELMMPSVLEEDPPESAQGVICDGEKWDENIQKMEAQEVQDESYWQRSVSRSTRRKQNKRAARVAMQNSSNTLEMGSFDGHQKSMAASQAFHANSDALHCSEDLKYGDAMESTVDEISLTQDGEISDEDCPTLSETSIIEATGAISSQDVETEASWTLNSLSVSNVACVTADFSMQNVLLQIGLRVLSPNGLQIQQLQRWALKCQACRNVTSDVGRIFCPRCGNGGTLYKVSITIGPNGIIHSGTKKRFNIRGTKYSLPLPKGGRKGVVENPILREDQLPKKMLHSKKKATKHDFTSPAELFVMKSEGKKEMEPPLREALAIFSGKRNPNRTRSKQRG